MGLWALGWFACYFGLWWLSLILAVPAAGAAVHDPARLRSRRFLANDWVGRVISVLTLTPYDFWRRTHAIHHASSGHLERRGIGDVETLTVREYLARSFWGRFCYRTYRNPLVMFGLGPTYLFVLQQRLPVGMMRRGWQPWFSTMATNVAIAGIVATLIWCVGIQPFWCTYPLFCSQARSGYGYSTSSISSSGHSGLVTASGTCTTRPYTEAHTTTCRESCAGSRPTLVCTMYTICAAGFLFIAYHEPSATIPSFVAWAGSHFWRVFAACVSRFGTKVDDVSFRSTR